jgi:primase-polymerase (primpol)-like protein
MDPGTWGTYEEALAVAGEGGGVGYVLTPDDPYSVIDLDSCRDPETGEIEPAAAEVVRLLDSYTEISPSGKGLHVWLRGRLPGERRRKGKLEMYDRARYVTVTGHVLPGYTEIRERQEELGELYRRTFGDASEGVRRHRGPEVRSISSAGDEEIIARMLADAEGRRLWAGDTSLHNDDPSRADLALLNRLARHTRDPERLDRLFRLSGLYRPKWERSDYRGRTIARALSGTPPGRSRGTPPVDPSGG